MAFDEEHYKQYSEKLYSLTSDEMYSEDTVERLFHELLLILPNGGKLYKYKALDTFHIDELADKYIWMSSAKNLNDNLDCTLQANTLQQMEEMARYWLTNENYRKDLAKNLSAEFEKTSSNLKQNDVERMLLYVEKYGVLFKKIKFYQFCSEQKLNHPAQQKIERIFNTLSSLHILEAILQNGLQDIYAKMEHLRSDVHICSLTTSYQKDSMWAYYCNNKGICLEYDFSKAKEFALKKVLIHTQKVFYGKKENFSYLDIIKLADTGTSSSLFQANSILFKQLLTKNESWSNEEEWRIIDYIKNEDQGKKLEGDLISAVYLDYSILEEEKTKEILTVARKNHLKVYVRYYDKYMAEYLYDTIDNIKKLKKQYQLVGLK